VIEPGAVSDHRPPGSHDHDADDARAGWRRGRQAPEDTSVGEVFEYVKAYAKQETLGPLAGAGRWLAYGAAGAVALSTGIGFLLLGLLRFLQYEFRTHLDESWTWVSYLIVLLVTLVLLWVTISRIRRSTLRNEPR